MAKKEEKVFDVAKPGSSAPQTGSKPMVVGHKIMKDPSINENDEAVEKDEPIAQSSKIKIEPLTENEKEETVDSPDKSEKDEIKEAVSDTEEKKVENDVKDSSTVKPLDETKSVDEVIESDETVNEKDTEEPVKDLAEVAVEQEENLQKIIKNKTYNVQIEEASYSAFKTFIKTFIIVFLIGIVALLLIIDAEIIDLGVELPFDFL